MSIADLEQRLAREEKAHLDTIDLRDIAESWADKRPGHPLYIAGDTDPIMFFDRPPLSTTGRGSDE